MGEEKTNPKNKGTKRELKNIQKSLWLYKKERSLQLMMNWNFITPPRRRIKTDQETIFIRGETSVQVGERGEKRSSPQLSRRKCTK